MNYFYLVYPLIVLQFIPYQPIVSPTVKDKKKESNQPVIQTIPVGSVSSHQQLLNLSSCIEFTR